MLCAIMKLSGSTWDWTRLVILRLKVIIWWQKGIKTTCWYQIFLILSNAINFHHTAGKLMVHHKNHYQGQGSWKSHPHPSYLGHEGLPTDVHNPFGSYQHDISILHTNESGIGHWFWGILEQKWFFVSIFFIQHSYWYVQ
jgi:hypothetical protein